MRRATLLVTTLALLLVVGAACSDGDDGSAGSEGTGAEGPAPSVDQLVGRSFLPAWTSLSGTDGLVSVDGLRLTFDEDRLSFQARCNTFSGEWSLDGDVLVAGPFGGTQMGCEEALHAQDEAIAAFLEDRPTLALEGDELTISTDTDAVGFQDEQVAVPDAPLEGTTWRLTTLVTGAGDDAAASSLPQGVVEEPTLTIAGGEVRLHDGCNEISGTVDLADGTMFVVVTGTTEVGCPELEELTSAVRAVVEGESAYEVDGTTLTLTRGDRGLVYEAG